MSERFISTDQLRADINEIHYEDNGFESCNRARKEAEAEVGQFRTALDNMTEVARLAQEAAATAEIRAANRCAEIAYNYRGEALVGAHKSSEGIAVAIRKEYGL